MPPTYAHFENIITNVSPKVLPNSQKSSKTAKKSSRSKPTFRHQSCTPQTSPEYAQYQLLIQRCVFSIPN